VSTLSSHAHELSQAHLEKLSDARTYLLYRHPFFGRLAMLLRPRAARGKTTTFAITPDGTLLVDPRCLEKLDVGELAFVIAHECLHLGFLHFQRQFYDRSGRARCLETWAAAADFAINGVLAKTTLPIPNLSPLLDERWDGWSDEDIYEALMEEGRQKREDAPSPTSKRTDGDGERGVGLPAQGELFAELSALKDNRTADEIGWGTGHGDADFWGRVEPEQPTFGDISAPPVDWRREMIAAAQAARGDLPRGIARWSEQLVEGPPLSWKEILARHARRHLQSDARTSYRRPSRRSASLPRSPGGIRPILRGPAYDRAPVVIAFDTSGSMSGDTLTRAKQETAEILAHHPGVRIRVLSCDAEIHTDDWIENLEEIRLRGGGGSSTVPVFRRLEEEGIMPPLLIYFSDLFIRFPERAPAFPTLWVTPQRRGSDPPFGAVISMSGCA